MFLSTLLPPQRVSKMRNIIGMAPKEIKSEIDEIEIVYRGMVSMDGKEGDLLVRLTGNKVYNIVWKEDYGEMREMDRGMLKQLLKSYDTFIQEMVVRESNRLFKKMYVVNQKVVLRTTPFKGVSPIS